MLLESALSRFLRSAHPEATNGSFAVAQRYESRVGMDAHTARLPLMFGCFLQSVYEGRDRTA